jgi:hypothetical protein
MVGELGFTLHFAVTNLCGIDGYSWVLCKQYLVTIACFHWLYFHFQCLLLFSFIAFKFLINGIRMPSNFIFILFYFILPSNFKRLL